MSRLDSISAALERLRDAYQRDDAAGIEAASDRLDELGHATLALEGLDPMKRKAIELLYFDSSDGVGCLRPRPDWTGEVIADLLRLPSSIVGLVIMQAWQADGNADEAEEEALEAELEAELEADRAAARAAERQARTVPCAKCGAPAGKPCSTAKGPAPAHAQRKVDAGIPRPVRARRGRADAPRHPSTRRGAA